MSLADVDVKMDNFDLNDDGFSMLEEYPGIDLEGPHVDPQTATVAKPGSEEKVCMLAARYAAGLPLWHNEDCVDHGPDGELEED
ncbi:MAG: hypothetical protein P8M20_04075 [Planctomycetaceae bacterium]|jgi:hypothetical protein|nr:hypothetical protein [Planctomycetaceae bacterium]